MKILANPWILAVLFVFAGFAPSGKAQLDRTCSGLFPFSVKSEENDLEQRWGLIDCNGDTVVAAKYNEAYEFTDGVAVVAGPKESLIVSGDKKVTRVPGLWIIAPFGSGISVGKIGEKVYSVSKNGKTVSYLFNSNFCYTSPCFISGFLENGYALVNTTEGLKYVDKNGRFLKLPADITPSLFVAGVAVAQGDNGFGLIDSSGRVVVPLRHENAILDPSDGLIAVKEKSGFTIYLDLNGREVLRTNFDYAGRFSEGLAEIESAGKWGFIDRHGRISIKPSFDAVKEFSEGLAAVQQSAKWGFVSPTGDYEIPARFDQILKPFKNGLAYVRDDVFEGYIDHKGRWVWKRKI